MGFCTEEGHVDFSIPMAVDDARSVIDTFGKQFHSVLLLKPGPDRIHVLPTRVIEESSGTVTSGGPTYYNSYSVAGVQVTGADGKVLYASGLFR